MKLPAKNSHVRRALELAAEHGGEMDVRCGSVRFGQPRVLRDSKGKYVQIAYRTWLALAASWGLSGIPYSRGHIRLDDALVQRLLAAKKAAQPPKENP